MKRIELDPYHFLHRRKFDPCDAIAFHDLHFPAKTNSPISVTFEIWNLSFSYTRHLLETLTAFSEAGSATSFHIAYLTT